MAFIRVKKIKNKEYAYLVENDWKKKGSRQKVKEYLGKICRFEFQKNIGFLEYLGISNFQSFIESSNKEGIINNLIEWEFSKYNVDKSQYLIDLSKGVINKNNRNVVFMINDGFMCNLTLKNLIEFKPTGDEENDGYRLARAFVEAGIKVPQEIFVGLFGKLYNNRET